MQLRINHAARKGLPETFLVLGLCLVLIFVLLATTARAQNEIRREISGREKVEPLRLKGKLYYQSVRSVRPEQEGHVVQFNVHEGEYIERDQVIATVRLTREALDDMLPRTQNPRIAEAEADLFELDTQIEAAKYTERDTRAMVEAKLASPRALIPHERQLALLEQKRIIAVERLDREKEFLKDRLEQLAEELGVSSVSPGNIPAVTKVRAPRSGHVTWAANVQKGQYVNDRSILINIGRVDPMVIKVRVYEEDYRRLEQGMIADCVLDSNKNIAFQAWLTRLPLLPSSGASSEESYYDVEFTTANPDFTLKEGYKVDLNIPQNEEAGTE